MSVPKHGYCGPDQKWGQIIIRDRLLEYLPSGYPLPHHVNWLLVPARRPDWVRRYRPDYDFAKNPPISNEGTKFYEPFYLLMMANDDM